QQILHLRFIAFLKNISHFSSPFSSYPTAPGHAKKLLQGYNNQTSGHNDAVLIQFIIQGNTFYVNKAER
ncbi:MAG: hypothetical protein IKI32_02455, partial [Lachnospiraceae bacterium]|nr:hypothetical protein [Lachnospiraceae bacterium]